MVFEFLIVGLTIVSVLLAVLGVVATLYVFYDVLFKRPEMEDAEKIIWILLVLVFNIVGVIIYVFVVIYQESYMFESGSLRGGKDLDDLERLNELRENGALSEEEFQEQKERILEKREEED